MPKIRYYKNLFVGIIQGLYHIHTNEKYADQIVAKLLKSNKKWGSKDRRFVAETIYDITRYRRLFYTIAQVNPNEASKDELWKVVAVWCVKNGYEFPRWEEFSAFNYDAVKTKIDEAKSDFVLWESIPDWLNELGEQALGTGLWQKEIQSLNKEAEVVLRVNSLAFDSTIENTVGFVQNSLQSQGVNTIELSDYNNALQLKKRQNVQHTSAYEEGRIEIQDANSQLVAPFTKVQPGMKVIDACAGGGGKSLHLADLMNNSGEIYAYDILEWKLNNLKKRAERAKATIISASQPEEKQLILQQNKADVVLIDAPCSGLGTLRRKADLKWKLTAEFIEEVIKIQRELLPTYASLVQPGGTLVYATCSILPQENQEQINWFLQTKEGKSFELSEAQQLYSHSSGFDGFYMARLQKNDE